MQRNPRAPISTQPNKKVMDKFLEFMADILDVQEKLSSGEYKKLSESANALYESCIQDKQNYVDAHEREHTKMIAMADKALESIICLVVRDEPWKDLTANKVREIVAERCGPSVQAHMIDMHRVKAIVDREIRLLVADGRKDPAGGKRKRS